MALDRLPKIDVQDGPGAKNLDYRTLRQAGLVKFYRKTCVPSQRKFKKIRQYVEEMEGQVIDALGGPDLVTPQKEILIKVAMRALQVALLLELYINKEGAVRKDLLDKGIVEIQPALEKTVTFYNSCRLNLMAVGLDAVKADEVLTLAKYTALEDQGAKGDGGNNGLD